MTFRYVRSACLLGVAASLFLSTAGHSQTAVDEKSDTKDDAAVEDAITITARKHLEKVSDAPVSTTILNEDDIRPSALDPGAEIAGRSPTTNFVDYSRFGETFMNMRGVATLGTPLNSLDSTIGFAADGVPTSISGFAPILLDVERVEVLRGPQGTTFGRNALGGIVNVVHRKADGTDEAHLTAETGSDGHTFVEAAGGASLVPDTLALRGAVRYQKYDGHTYNSILDRKVGGAHIGAGRASLRYTPDHSLTIDLTGSYSRDERSNPAYLLLETPDFPTSGEDVVPKNRRILAQGTLDIQKDWEDFTFTSVTSYQQIDIWNYGDFTDTLILSEIFPLPSLWTNPAIDKVGTAEEEGLFTQEFRLNSPQKQLLQWVVGANYFRSDYTLDRTANNNPLVGATFNGTWDNRITSQTIALFGDVSVPLGLDWEVTGGLRLARDTQTLESHYKGAPPLTVASLDQKSSFADNYASGHAGLTYHWGEGLMSYASIARGYASGGFEKATPFASQGATSPPFHPAKSWTYEFGTKSVFGTTAQLDVAAFYNEVKDGQLTGFDSTTFQVYTTNQDYESYGVEASGQLRLTDWMALFGGVGYTESEMVNVGGASGAAGARNGNRVPQVPKWTANLGISLTLPGEYVALPGTFYLRAQEQYMGARYADLANAQKMEDYNIVDARIGWRNENLDFYAFGDNLLDERPISFSVDYAGPTAVYAGRGRLLGIGTSVKW